MRGQQLIKSPDPLWSPSSTLFSKQFEVSSPRQKQPGRETDRVHLPRAEVKNDWSLAATPLCAFREWIGTDLPPNFWQIILQYFFGAIICRCKV